MPHPRSLAAKGRSPTYFCGGADAGVAGAVLLGVAQAEAAQAVVALVASQGLG